MRDANESAVLLRWTSLLIVVVVIMDFMAPRKPG